MLRESELIHFFESRFLNESKLIHSDELNIFSESTVVWASSLIVTVLVVDVFC